MQHAVDAAASMHIMDELLANANQFDHARLLAITAPHSIARVSAVPVEVLGLLSDAAVCVNIAVRLDTPV